LRPFDNLSLTAHRDLYSTLLPIAPFLALEISLAVTYLLLLYPTGPKMQAISCEMGGAFLKWVISTEGLGVVAFPFYLSAFLFDTGVSPFWGACVITITIALALRVFRLCILFSTLCKLRHRDLLDSRSPSVPLPPCAPFPNPNRSEDRE